MSPEDIRLGLEPPATTLVEDGALRPERIATAGTLCLSVLTRTAHDLPIADLFVEALSGHIALDLESRCNVATALHEAVINAVLHGNLDITSEARDTLTTLDHFDGLVAERLASPLHAGRTVMVEASWDEAFLSVSVTDQGTGCPEPETTPRQLDKWAVAHGRGLAIIAALTDAMGWDVTRTRLTIGFRRPESTSI